MKMPPLFAIAFISFLFFVQPVEPVSAEGWSPVVIPTGDYRLRIKSLPISERPGRPMHVYGNTIRMLDRISRDQPVRPLRHIFLGRSDR